MFIGYWLRWFMFIVRDLSQERTSESGNTAQPDPSVKMNILSN